MTGTMTKISANFLSYVPNGNAEKVEMCLYITVFFFFLALLLISRFVHLVREIAPMKY